MKTAMNIKGIGTFTYLRDASEIEILRAQRELYGFNVPITVNGKKTTIDERIAELGK